MERALLQTQLGLGWSPEQIAFTLGSMDKPVRLSHETIYTALYAIHPTDEDLSVGPRLCRAVNCAPAF
jgi:IS30 family transposase